MERIDYLPLGSVVLLRGGTQKLFIVARAISVQRDGRQFFFDYGGVLYPDGLTGDRMAYFHHESINQVLFEGCNDAENQNMVDIINSYLAANPDIVRGDPQSWE